MYASERSETVRTWSACTECLCERSSGMTWKDPHKRFWLKVDKNGPIAYEQLGRCWLWTGAKNSFGYGIVCPTSSDIKPRRYMRAHRLAFEFTNGPLPEGLSVLHKCDVPACVRPDHLFLGTTLDNMRDMRAKGRGFDLSPRIKLSRENVLAIRKDRSDGVPNKTVAARYGVTPQTVCAITSRRAWGELS